MCMCLCQGCTPIAHGPGATRSARPIAFVGVNVIPMTPEDSILSDRTVIVRDGHIAVIGPAAAGVPSNALRIDGRGRYLTPGLVDAHVHLEYFDEPSVLGLFVANGITSVRNMDGRPYLLEWKRRTASSELLGPTIYTAGPILDGDPPARDDHTVVRDPTAARVAVARQDSAGYDFVKVYRNLAPDAYRAILEAARDRGLAVAGHVPTRVSLRDVLTSTHWSIEHLSDFDELIEAETSPVRGRYHWSKQYLAMPVDSALISEAATGAAASGVWIVPTVIQADRALAPLDSVRAWLAVPEIAHIPADAREFWSSIGERNAARVDSVSGDIYRTGRANRRALLRAFRVAGAKIAAGTDTPNPFVVPGFSLHDELAVFTEAGFTPIEAMAAATRRASQLLRASDSVGTVELGKRADLLLLSCDPRVNLNCLHQPLGVLLRGRWLDAEAIRTMLQQSAAANGR